MTWLGYDEDAVARYAQRNKLTITPIEMIGLAVLGGGAMFILIVVVAIIKYIVS